jgi:hypothetical protein
MEEKIEQIKEEQMKKNIDIHNELVVIKWNLIDIKCNTYNKEDLMAVKMIEKHIKELEKKLFQFISSL